jgi:uncharacterized protein (TIGR02246 family)
MISLDNQPCFQDTSSAFGYMKSQHHNNRRASLLSLVAAGVLSLLVAACANQVAPGKGGTTKSASGSSMDVAAEIAAEFKKSTLAWNSGDLEGFTSIYADSATFAQREVFIVGRPQIRTLYGPLFEPGANRPTLTLERLDVEPLCQGVALVRGIYRNSRDGAVLGRGTTSLVMRLIEGRWRIIHDHSS